MRVKKLMLTAFALLLLCTSCELLFECDPYNYPEPPYPEPDQTNIYESETFNSITYVYECYDNKHRSIEYSRSDICDSWLRSDVIMKCQ